jgi:hypothetical protein
MPSMRCVGVTKKVLVTFSRLKAVGKYTLPHGLFLLKGILALLSFGYLLHMLEGFPWNRWPEIEWGWFIGLLILAPLNWSLEVLKWRSLSTDSIKIKYSEWFKVFLAGMATSLFSPNRTGEAIGRILSLPHGLRWALGTSAILGNLAQLCITILIGAIAWEYWLPFDFFPEEITEFRWGFRFLFGGLLLFFIIRIPFVLLRMHRWAPKRWRAHLKKSSRGIHPQKWVKGLCWALARYCIFLVQWWIGLNALGANFSLFHVVPSVALVFFGNALIPSFALSELTSRGSLSILFLGGIGVDPPTAFMVSSLLWIINIALPATPGFFFLLKNPNQL